MDEGSGRREEQGGLDGRITRSLPVAPARASVSARAAPFPFSLHHTYVPTTTTSLPLYIPLFVFSSSIDLRLSFLDEQESSSLPFFFSFLFFSSHLHPRCGVTKLPRTANASKLSHNGVTCPLLSRALVISYRLRSSLSLPLTTPFVILFYYTWALVQIGWMRKRERERERWQVLDRASIYNINPRCSWNRVVGATCR